MVQYTTIVTNMKLKKSSDPTILENLGYKTSKLNSSFLLEKKIYFKERFAGIIFIYNNMDISPRFEIGNNELLDIVTNELDTLIDMNLAEFEGDFV